MHKFLLVPFIFIIFITGCSRNIPTLEQRNSNLDDIIKDQNYKKQTIGTKYFDIFTVQDTNSQCKNINAYIEGDGLSWITRSIRSDDPTPLNPVALKLMKQDESDCKIYLARPCQYVHGKSCEVKYWTSHRFNSKVIKSYDELLSKLKEKYKNDTFTLIGYSGGAAIASLSASKRDDISTLVTVAGNLNVKLWTDMKNFSPLYGSLDPIDFTQNLQDIKQYHLIGTKDRVIPQEILFSYMGKFSKKENIKYKQIEATHSCCYEEEFKKLIKGKNR